MINEKVNKAAPLIELTKVFAIHKNSMSGWRKVSTWHQGADIDPHLIQEVDDLAESDEMQGDAGAHVKLSNGNKFYTVEDRKTVREKRNRALGLS